MNQTNMAILKYNDKRDKFVWFIITGSDKSIWDLWYRLAFMDNSLIGDVIVTNMEGVVIDMHKGYSNFCGLL